MVHDLRSDLSGLERDCRQDEHPTRDLGRQDEFPTAYNIAEESFHNADPPIMPNIISDLPLPKPAPKTQKRVCGLRVSTFWLVAIVAVLLVLTGVGAGVLGSKISSKKDDTYNRERYVLRNGKKRARSMKSYIVWHGQLFWDSHF